MRHGDSLTLSSNGRVATFGAQTLFAVVVPLVMLPLALSSRPLAGVFAAVLLAAILVPFVGTKAIGSALLVAGFGTVPLNDVHPIHSLAFLELSDAFFVMGIVFLIPSLLTTHLHVPLPLLVGGIGFLTVGVLSAFASASPMPNFKHLLDVVRGILVLPVLLAWWKPSLGATIAAASAYLVGNVVNVAASLIQGTTVDGRSVGLTTHPNALGASQAMGIALVPFLLGVVAPPFRWLVVVAAAINAYGIWISGSRAALLCAILLTLAYPVLRRSIFAALGVVAAALPAMLAVNLAAQSISSSSALGRLLGAGTAASNEARATGAREGIEQALKHPLFGDGFANVWYAHDIYIEVAAAIGLIGFVFFLMMLQPMLRPLVAVRAPYGLLAMPALATVMIGLTDPALGVRYLWAAAALGLNAAHLAELAAEKRSGGDRVSGPPTATSPHL